MRYIRTKDGIYEVNSANYTIVDGFITVNALHKNIIGIRTSAIVNQADTVEELCDEFVILGTRHISLGIPYATCEERNIPITKIRGAIWTDKGLIYVAKMNDKGELELL